MPPGERRELLRRALAVVVWLVLLRGLVPFGNWLAPRILSPETIARTPLQSYLLACQIAALVLGLGASLLLLRERRTGLGLARLPAWSGALSTLFAVPVVFVASSYIALQIALPTLLEEVRTRGAGASAQNAGEFGRAITQGPLLLTLLWGALLGAIGEELFFRGLLWSSITEFTRRFSPGALRARAGETPATPPPSSPEPRSTPAAPPRSLAQRALAILFEGGIATVLCAALFGWMHNDLPGGVGIVRVVSTTVLGLASGVVRHVTGSVLACILLHATYNTLVIGAGKKWFASRDEPVLEGIPNALVTYAVAGLLAALALTFVRALLARRARSTFVAE